MTMTIALGCMTVAPIEKECCRILEIWIKNRIKRQQQNVQIVRQLRKLNYVFRILNWSFQLVHIVPKVPNKFISTCLTNVLQNVHSIQIRCLYRTKKNNLNDINHRAIHYAFHNISLERKKKIIISFVILCSLIRLWKKFDLNTTILRAVDL